MSNTSSASSIGDVPDYSVWGDEFNMEAFRTNPDRWNKDWEKTLRTRPASEVFTHMTDMFLKNDTNKELIPMLTNQLVGVQGVLVKLWDSVDELGGHFRTAWVLLDEKERIRHLKKGFEDAYDKVGCRQDSRCWAPEITVTNLLKRKGHAFLELLEEYVKGKKEVGVGKPYFHPNVWWDRVLEGVTQPVLDGLDEYAVEASTIHRNDFMTKYLLYATMSVFHDLGEGSSGMKPVTEFLRTANNLVRCQNCTTTQAEGSPKFMLCSTCKSKLDFTIHYCSVKCQREDWGNHKPHCGKAKVAKKLPGTIHDPFWFQPGIPDGFRNISTNNRGTVDMASLGFVDAKNAPPYSGALQRQVNLITADRGADYFLFDNLDRPIRFVLEDPMLKTGFRIMRTEAFSSATPKTVSAMLEYIIKAMSRKPGLSREGIIAQFTKEYKGDFVDKLVMLESHRAGGPTILEGMSQGMSHMMKSYT